MKKGNQSETNNPDASDEAMEDVPHTHPIAQAVRVRYLKPYGIWAAGSEDVIDAKLADSLGDGIERL